LKRLRKIAYNENPDIKTYMESIGFFAKTINSIDVYYKQVDGIDISITTGPDKKLLPVDNDQNFNMHLEAIVDNNQFVDDYNFTNLSSFQSGWNNIIEKFKESIAGESSE
jgi:hypothetical protein